VVVELLVLAAIHLVTMVLMVAVAMLQVLLVHQSPEVVAEAEAQVTQALLPALVVMVVVQMV
jgi:hypothetical protein